MSTQAARQKAPYEDLLNKALVLVAVSALTAFLYTIGFTRLKKEWKEFNEAFEEPPLRRQPPPHSQSQAQKDPKQQNQDPKPPILKASDHHLDAKHHLLLAATGSVATIKIPLILKALSHHPNLSIRLILSESARQFLQSQSAEQPSITEIAQTTPNLDGIYFDEDEWSKPWVRGDSILHIELRRWADLMVVAPLSANGLAKLSQGVSDNLVSSVVRAWDWSGLIDGARPGVPLPYSNGKSREELEGLPEAFREGGKKGIVVAPAMNTAMWSHPVTAKQLRVLEEEWGVERGGWFEVLRPVEKRLACGDTGSGAMRGWEEIVEVIERRLSLVDGKGEDVKRNV
jgi:phosphopantothenoylcysteine decarboxylase